MVLARFLDMLRAGTPVLALLLLAPLHARAQNGIGLPLGSTPAPVAIEDLDGQPVNLGQYLGKQPALFEFWATWCPLCKQLEPRMQEAARRFGDRIAFVVVAVGVNQTPRSIKRHVAQHPIPGRILWDGEGRAVRAFRAPTTSYVVVVNAAGKVVYTGTGGDQDIQAALARALSP